MACRSCCRRPCGRCLRGLRFLSDAFSAREPVSTSLENAINPSASGNPQTSCHAGRAATSRSIRRGGTSTCSCALASVVKASAWISVPARIAARAPMISIARCTERLLSCCSSTGTLAARSAKSSVRCVELGKRKRARRKAPFGGLAAGHRVARQHQFHGAAHADQPGVILHVGRAHQPHRRIADLGVVGDVDDIAGGGEFGAAGKAIAVHLRDHGLGEIPDPEPALDDVARPLAGAAAE